MKSTEEFRTISLYVICDNVFNSCNLIASVLLTTVSIAAVTSLQHWELVGTAVASDEHIRLTPDHQSKQGAVWNVIVSFNWKVLPLRYYQEALYLSSKRGAASVSI